MAQTCRGVLALLAAGWFCLSAISAQEAGGDCKLHRVANLDMVLDAAGRPSISVRLNGVPRKFVIDTAGIYSGVTTDAVQELQLKTARLQKKSIYSEVSGVGPTQVAYVESMKVGSLPLPNMALYVLGHNGAGSGVDGLLSGDVLHALDVEFDFAAAKFALFYPNECPAHIVHWTNQPYVVLPFRFNAQTEDNGWRVIMRSQDWHIVIPAVLDGHDIDVTIDSGASTSFMLASDADTILSAEDRKTMTPVDVDSGPENTVYSYQFKKLDLGAVQVLAPKVLIFPRHRQVLERAGNPRPQLTLGASALSQLHLYIAYRDRKIYLTPASAH